MIERQLILCGLDWDSKQKHEDFKAADSYGPFRKKFGKASKPVRMSDAVLTRMFVQKAVSWRVLLISNTWTLNQTVV